MKITAAGVWKFNSVWFRLERLGLVDALWGAQYGRAFHDYALGGVFDDPELWIMLWVRNDEIESRNFFQGESNGK